MRKLIWFMGGFAAVALLTLLMGPTGGYPSRPRFFSAGFGTIAPTSGNEKLRLAAEDAYISFYDSTGATRQSYIQDNNDAGIGLTLESEFVDRINLRTTGTEKLAINSNTLTSFTDLTVLQNVVPIFRYDESDGAADERLWEWNYSAGRLSLLTRTDAGAFVEEAITLERTAGVVDSISLNANALVSDNQRIMLGERAYSASVTSRTNDATNTCDANLTILLANTTRAYAFTALLIFDGNGITANGWSILPGASQGTVTVLWHARADTNTTAANAAPTGNQGASGGDMDAVFNAAGAATYVTVDGTVQATAGGTAPGVCIAWGQTASNATATDLNIGSYLVLTSLQ